LSIGKDVLNKKEKIKPLRPTAEELEEIREQLKARKAEELDEERPVKFPNQLKTPKMPEQPNEIEDTFPFEKEKKHGVKAKARLEV
jgi:hypothetical protein